MVQKEPVARSSFFRRLKEACRANLCFHLAMWRMRIPWLSSILFSQFQKGVLLDMANSILETISSEFASAAEKVGSSVVAVHARRWMPTSGIEWKKGVVVTVHHGVQRDEEINVLLGSGRAVSAKLAGRDPSTAISAPSWAGPICTRNGRVPKGISTIFTIAFATSNTSAPGDLS